MQVSTTNHFARCALLFASLAGGLTAQTKLDLRELVPGRGLVALGAGGIVGQPPLLPPYDVIEGALGRSVAWADLDGDGYDDLVVGAPDLPSFPSQGTAGHSGHVYVVFGAATAGNPAAPGDLELPGMACTEVLDLVGGVDERFGTSVASAGDVNGDGFDDLIIGAPECGPNYRGAAYLLYGSADLDDLPGTLPNCRQFISGWLGTRATLLTGSVAFGVAGTAVGGGVDVNADGLDDVIIGAPLASIAPRIQNGTATVLYGKPGLVGMVSVDLGSLAAGQGTVVRGVDDFQFLGQSVAGLGRFDPVLPGGGEHATLGDDVALGAPGTSGSGGLFSGAVYVLRGVAAGNHAVSYDTGDFGSAPGSAGPVWFGAGVGDQAGSFVAGAGDLIDPGDGFVELLVGAPLHDGLGRSDAGALYLLAGRLDGSGPTGFALSSIGGSGSESGLRLVGPVAFVAQQGIVGSAAGDFDGNGLPDLAIGLPGATVSESGPAQPLAGTVTLIDGGALQPPLDHSIDLAALGAFQLMRLQGETAGVLAGAALAGGDHDGDGHLDLAVGAPGAPSDPDPFDVTGVAFSHTGRGHVLYGPLLRPSSLSPAASWNDGPVVELGVFNLDSIVGVSVTVGGQAATIDSLVAGSPGSLTFEPPVPLVPGAAVDVTIATPTVSVTLADAFTSLAISIDTGPDPVEVVKETPIAFTGTAFSNNITVEINGTSATVLEVDPLAGTLLVEAPGGQPAFTPLDISIQGANGDVLLQDVLTYRPFILADLTPTSGPQTSGIFNNGANLTYKGEPALPISFDMVTSNGVFPPETTVEFGNDTLGWREAVVTGTSGDAVTVDLPYFLLGPADRLVDLRVTTNLDQLVVEDAFTYLASDFTHHEGTASAGFGAGPPRVLMAGGWSPNEEMLLLLDNYPPDEITFGYVLIGAALLDPPVPVKSGLLGLSLIAQQVLPGGFLAGFGGTLPSNPSLVPMSDQHGISLFLQFVTVEKSGLVTAYGFSDVLEMTVRIDPGE